MLAVVAVMGYGWRKLFIGQREKNELGREKLWSRIHLTPLLQAEEDRDQVRRYYADKAREKEFLGSESSYMNSDRYVKNLPAILIRVSKLARMAARLYANWFCSFVRPTFSYAPTLIDK